MIDPPYKKVVFSMLSDSGEPVPETKDDTFGEIGWVDYPMPPEMGQGGYEALELALGMSLVHSRIAFSPAMSGQWLPMMAVDAEFKEVSFQAMTVRGLRGSVKEDFPPAQLAISPGMDLFRHVSHYRSSFTADGGFSGETYHVSLSQTMLAQLIGGALAERLLKHLSIDQSPSITVRAIPLHVSRSLVDAMSPLFTGQMRKLYCQGKLLEYFAALAEHVADSPPVATDRSQQARQRSRDIHDNLLACEGKFPTLDELASQYGRSAKLLNEEFCTEYGQSINGFFTDQRLLQAHALLEQSQMSIKQLAAKLGYAHVSNFTIAFKRKFGYPPGSLQRR